METKYIDSKHGYEIPYYIDIPIEAKRVIIISHGFGSSKDSPTAQMMLKGLPEQGIGAVAFDFPTHGESKAAVADLRVDNCIDDVRVMEELVMKLQPKADIGYFSSSFGAYINLLFLGQGDHKGNKSFLRSAAVNMLSLFDDLTPAQQEELKETGQVTVDDPPVAVSQAFLDDLKENDLFSSFMPDGTKLGMVHGNEDKIIEPKIAVTFSAYYDVPAAFIPGGPHNLCGEGMPEQVFQMALEFFEN